MTSKELRQKFLNFFEKREHKIVPSSSLLPTDPSVLFTTAGMQQFKPYYLGEKSPYGKNVASCQKCFRTSDVEEVGDESHLTFIEMLGNFSFGGYFKEEAIKLALEFLIENCKPSTRAELGAGLKIENFTFTYFKGDKEVPEDVESKKIWLNLGIPENKIIGMGREDNFWGPTGEEGPCGPTTEIHIKGTEVWNLVFNEYYQDKKRRLAPLKQKGVDTGMGLERLAMIVQEKNSVYETDLFLPIINEIPGQGEEDKSSSSPNELPAMEAKVKMGTKSPLPFAAARVNEKAKRIIADHVKGSVFLISEDVLPSNVERGYVLRRILRRAVRYGKLLNLPKNFLIPLAKKVIKIYKDVYPEIKSKETETLTVIQNETEKFEKTLDQGLKEFEKMFKEGKFKTAAASGIAAFDLYQSYGFPLELTEELVKERGGVVNAKQFEEVFKKHREISRAGVEKKFGGVGLHLPTTLPLSRAPEASYESAKLHTATHLLHAALRNILGEHVKQMGSDITPQRLRFDFSHLTKMTQEQIRKVEDLVNQKIKEDLEVKKEEMSYRQAIKSGALAFFKEKYPEKVSVFSICPSTGSGQAFSKEICAGPHVNKTSELGSFKIIKEESSGAGVRRIRAVLTPASMP